MKRAVLAAMFFLIWLPAGWVHAAVTNCASPVDCVPRLNTVFNVRGSDLSGDAYTSFYLVSYGAQTPSGIIVTPQDGAAGLFTRAACNGRPDDGGAVLKDANGLCFFRQNLNGDLRQWGVIQGSSYDAIANPNGVVGVSNLINTKVVPGLAAAGLHTIHTGQVSVKLDYDSASEEPLTLPAGWSFTCDAPPVKQAAGADYTQFPGSLIIAHGDTLHPSFLDASKFSDVEVYGCAVVLPEWYINPSKADAANGGFLPDDLHGSIYDSFNVAAPKYADLEAIRADMIMSGDTASMAGQGAYIHDIATMGFDNCLNANSAPGFVGRNITMDCPIGAYFTSNGGGTSIKDLFNNPYLTRQSGGADSEEYFTIDNVQAGANGACQLKLKEAGNGKLDEITSSLTDAAFGRRGDPISFPAWVTGLNKIAMSCLSKGTGRFGNDPAWAVEVVQRNEDNVVVELVGSQYTSKLEADGSGTSVNTTGDWSANTGVLRIRGSISNLAVGMQVTSDDPNWPQCSGRPCPLAVTGIVARATGPDNASTTNDGYNGEVIVSQAVAASASGGANLFFYSAADPPEWPDGSIGTDCDGMATDPCFFYNVGERYVSGASPAGNAIARMPASRGGHLGAGFLLDDVSGVRGSATVAFGHYYNIATIDAEQCAFSLIKGDDHGELTAGNTVGLYVSGQSRGCDFVSQGPGPKGAGLVQDTFGRVDQPGSVTGTLSLPNQYDTGTLTVEGGVIPSAWPDRGELHICAVVTDGVCDLGTKMTPHDDEIVAYSKTGTNTIAINVRGRFGTAPHHWTPDQPPQGFFWTKINNGSDKHDDKSASTIFDDLDIPTTGSGNQFEVLHGGATLESAHTTSSGIGFVSSNASGVNVIAAGLPSTSILFEDGNAQSLTTVTPDSQLANYAPPGLTNLPMSILHPGGSIVNANGFSDLGTNGVGTINLCSSCTNAGWPQTGILMADQEEMAFALPTDSTDTTHLNITARGLCGTTPAGHSSSDIEFLVTELPCGAAGLKGYASNGFTIGSPTGGDKGAGALNAEAIYRNGGPVGAASNWAGGATMAQSVGATSYYPCQGYVQSVILTEAQVSSIASVAGTLRNLRVLLSAAPGLGKNVTVTVRVNGADTSLACSVSDTNTTCMDAADSASLVAGQTCSVRAASQSGVPAVQVHAATEFDN